MIEPLFALLLGILIHFMKAVALLVRLFKGLLVLAALPFLMITAQKLVNVNDFKPFVSGQVFVLRAFF